MEVGPDRTALNTLRIDRSAARAQGRGAGLAWGGVVLAVLVLAAAWWWGRPRPVRVQTVMARETATSEAQTVLNASGYVTARRQATVSSKVTGKVVEVMVEEGKRVEAGQILARLDDTNVRASLRLNEAQQEVSQAAVAETRALLDQAQKELKRVAELARDHISSESALDQAQAEVNSLTARLERQQQEVKAAEHQTAVWQQQLDDNIIRAPFAGIVVSKNAQPGEMISPISAGGGYTRTGICTIVDMTSLEIEVDVSESYIGRVEPGQPVVATLDAYPNWRIPCRVIAIIPTADRQKATVKVRIGFDQLDPRILPDMGVKVAFQGTEGAPVAKATNLILIPAAALRQQEGRDSVFILQNGRLEHRAITVMNRQRDEVTVSAGLAAGERVVLNAPAEAKAGSAAVDQNR